MVEEWMSADEAFSVVASAFSGGGIARRTILSRASAGVIKAKAKRLIRGSTELSDAEVPQEFWSSIGSDRAAKQTWAAGDFETWVRGEYVKAFGVSFRRASVDELVAPAITHRKPARSPSQERPPSNIVGRPAAAWWDDLWVEMCRQLYLGDLKPNRQADISSAMMKWASEHGHEPADSTIKERARKLWYALKKEDEN